MLPDFLVLKRQITADRTNEMRLAERNDSIVSLFGQIRQHEGDRFTVVSEDQTVHTSHYRHVEIEGTLKVSAL